MKDDVRAHVLVDAWCMGDTAAARKWGLTRDTVRHYRRLCRTDKVLEASRQALMSELQLDWTELRLAFLREAIDAARKRLATEDLKIITEAIRVIGELHLNSIVVEDRQDDAEASPGATQAAGPPPGDPAAH